MSKIKVPRPSIVATLAAETANKDERTIDVLFYSGATVPRFSWSRGEYNLTLSMEKGHIRLKSLNSGRAPVLDSHSNWDTGSVLGVVEKGWIEDSKAMATMRLAKNDPDANKVWNKIEQGILRNVSMGVRLHKLKETSKEEDKVKSYLATDWEPFEISIVPIGADPGAHIMMSADQPSEQEVEVESFAPDESGADVRATSPKEKSVADTTQTSGVDQARTEQLNATAAAEAERKRILGISNLAAKLKLETLAQSFIEDGSKTLEEFRAAALDHIASQQEQTETRSHRAEVTRDERDTFRLGLQEALLHRSDPVQFKLSDKDPGYQFRGMASMGLLRCAEECVRKMGKNPAHMSPLEVAGLAMHTTSDLPNILGATADRSLKAAYALAPQVWRQLGARRVVNNFRVHSELDFDMTANFPVVNEHGEYKYASVVEGKETYKVLTYGNKIGFTRQVIVNDDLNQITTVPAKLGMKAAIRQGNLFWTQITSNPNLSDGNALFSTAHNNLVTPGTAISTDNLGVARQKLRAQTDLGGDLIDIQPRYLVVPVAKEQLALQYTSANYQPTAQTGINPWVGVFTVLSVPQLDSDSATAWYIFADPAVAPVIVYAFLNGNEGIFTEVEQKLDPDGTMFYARFDFGVAPVDYRGAVKNLGA